MRLLDRYIGRVLLAQTVVVMLVLLSIQMFSLLISEMGRVGRADYTMWIAVQYALMQLPRIAYELFPLMVLLGAVLGLGSLANTSELTVMRAAGVSVRRVTGSVLKTGFLMLVVAVLFGELAAPELERASREMRAQALAQNVTVGGRDGVWAREEAVYVHFERLFPGGQATRVSLYSFDGARLDTVVQARQGAHLNGEWQLTGVTRTVFQPDRVTVEQLETLNWPSTLTPEVVEVAALAPERLSIIELYQTIDYLHANALDARQYELAFWIRAVLPFASAVMLLMAIPLVFGSQRSVPVGKRIMLGALLGIGFYIFNGIFNRLGLVYGLSPFVSAVTPTFIVFLVWMHLQRRIR